MAKDLKEQIEIMTYYLNGGEVEFSRDNFKTILGTVNKKYDGALSWDWATYTYRIKEPKEKVTIEKWLCRDYHGNFIVIETTGIDEYYCKKVKLIKSYEVEL